MDLVRGAHEVKGVYFDFGGVMASEGFRGGLTAIAEKNGKDPEEVYDTAVRLIRKTGWLTGESDETSFWRAFRFETGLRETDEFMRGEILSRFIVRDWMIAAVEALKASGVMVGILSDQTSWLDELDEEYGFMSHFDVVINSYHFGKSKYDGTIFDDAALVMGLPVRDILFIDDTVQHLERAKARGMKVIHFNFGGPVEFYRALKAYCPGLSVGGQ